MTPEKLYLTLRSLIEHERSRIETALDQLRALGRRDTVSPRSLEDLAEILRDARSRMDVLVQVQNMVRPIDDDPRED